MPKWYIEKTDSGQYYLKITSDKFTHTSDGLGEGLISLFFIVDALISNENDTIVIDEPELSLHPYLQKKLMASLIKHSTNKQIIYTTHSPYLIDFDSISNGGSITRLFKRNDEIMVASLSNETKSKIKSLINNLNNPHLIGLDAKEVFFLDDNIILLESQDDVMLYKKICDQIQTNLNGEYFGWGIGGAGNMKFIAKILKELDFKKVVGILDSDRKDDIPNLKNEFQEYFFTSIPTEDVKDKKAKNATSKKQGLLDDKFILKPAFVDEITKLFSDVNDYLKSSSSLNRQKEPKHDK